MARTDVEDLKRLSAVPSGVQADCQVVS
jgi:hypothetical protein